MKKMKFTNGFWLLKEEISPIYAVEYAGHEIEGNTLTVYAAQNHIRNRGDCLNLGIITLTFTSPQENIIHTELTHFQGTANAPVRPEVADQQPRVEITETDTHLIYRSGKLEARICKAPSGWNIDYYDGDTRLTSTGYRNEARMLNRDTGEGFMVEQLSIDIGESIYGLGERFTPFVKNGQTVSIWNEDGGTASEQTYKNIPFYITSKGYGVLVDTFGDLEFEIASEKVGNVQFSVPVETLG